MPNRLRFEVAYDGGPFAGWQSQAKGNTIQDLLEKSFAAVTQTSVRVHGAGRTDAGVHALAQIAHADVPERTLTPDRWVSALNASLPPAIRVLHCCYVTDSFHARFSAQGKIYRYRIWNARVLPPLEHGRAWQVASEIDLELMQRATQVFVGEHDFAAFAANRGKPERSTVREIERVEMKQDGPCLTIEFEGNGFLYKMVRLMVGALVKCGRGKMPLSMIEQRLQAPDRAESIGKIVAPAAGLYLICVRY